MTDHFAGDQQPVDAHNEPEVREREALEERVRRTHDNLMAWRKTALRRREAWDRAQEIAAQEARLRRQMWTQRAGVAAAAAFLIGLSAAFVAPRGELMDVRVPERRVPTVSHVVAPTSAPAALTAVDNHDYTVNVPPVPVTDSIGPGGLRVDAGTVRTWRDRAHQWVYFEVEANDATWMTWRDAAGKAVLTDMRCFRPEAGVRRCVAGRGLERIEAEVAAGAQEGTWSVEVCVPAGCTHAATFDVGRTNALARR
ncbi:MAG: hypothetical protein KTR31_25560 [Myxococcales bacterium]|nr:hypothetical protein [Myxococcales bacterium]